VAGLHDQCRARPAAVAGVTRALLSPGERQEAAADHERPGAGMPRRRPQRRQSSLLGVEIVDARQVIDHVDALGALRRTVPWARHTGRSSFVTSMRTTAVLLVIDTMRASAVSVPVLTGAR
jgi:hypothetical protein